MSFPHVVFRFIFCQSGSPSFLIRRRSCLVLDVEQISRLGLRPDCLEDFDHRFFSTRR